MNEQSLRAGHRWTRARLVVACVSWCLMSAAWPTAAKAAPVLYNSTPFSLQQISATFSPYTGGNLLITTVWQITNTSGSPWDDAILWYPGARLVTATTDQLAQWDDVQLSWSTSNATMRPFNQNGYLPLALSDAGVPSGMGIEPTDRLPVWLLGDVASGASVQVNLHRLLSGNVVGVFSTAVFVTTTAAVPAAVPEPASLVLLGLGLVGTAVRHRRRWSRPLPASDRQEAEARREEG